MICRSGPATGNEPKPLQNQMLSYLNPQMRTSSPAGDVPFLSTADGMANATSLPGRGRRVSSTSQEEDLVYPEYRGNGLWQPGQHRRGPHRAALVDFIGNKVGLHVNGVARILSNGAVGLPRCLRRPASRYR